MPNRLRLSARARRRSGHQKSSSKAALAPDLAPELVEELLEPPVEPDPKLLRKREKGRERFKRWYQKKRAEEAAKARRKRVEDEAKASAAERAELVAIVLSDKEDPIKPRSIARRCQHMLSALLIKYTTRVGAQRAAATLRTMLDPSSELARKLKEEGMGMRCAAHRRPPPTRLSSHRLPCRRRYFLPIF